VLKGGGGGYVGWTYIIVARPATGPRGKGASTGHIFLLRFVVLQQRRKPILRKNSIVSIRENCGLPGGQRVSEPLGVL